jgi:hypothetical protein
MRAIDGMLYGHLEKTNFRHLVCQAFFLDIIFSVMNCMNIIVGMTTLSIVFFTWDLYNKVAGAAEHPFQ